MYNLELQFKKWSRQTNSNLYHYAGNNPVRYIDPTGKFDFEDFFSGIGQLFSNKKDLNNKFSEYYLVPYDYEKNNCFDEDFLTSINNKLYVVKKTEYGSLTTKEKIDLLTKEYDKLLKVYEDNKTNGKDILKNIFFDSSESLSSIGSYSSIDEFCVNFFGNNIENIGDLAQFDLDEINLLLQMKIIDKEIIKLYQEYESE